MAELKAVQCIGCSADLADTRVAAFAIMDAQDFGITPAIKGPGRFHAAPVCKPCFVDPAHRKRNLKAHFALPADLRRMLGEAGSSSSVGGKFPGMDPNSRNQLWSAWTFTVAEAGRRVPRADVELNAARWLRAGFGSAGAARVTHTLTGWLIEARVEGAPAHDPQYVARVRRDFRERFVRAGWGPLAVGDVAVRILAGSTQDGRPAAQWVGLPTIADHADPDGGEWTPGGNQRFGL